MPKQKYEFPLIQMIELGVIVIVGFLAIPDISLTYRVVLGFVVDGALVVFSVFYDRSKRPKTRIKEMLVEHPKGIERSDEISITIKKATLRSILNTSLMVLEITEGLGFTIYIPLTSWSVLTVNGIPVMTYANFVTILFIAIGAVFLLDSGRRLRDIVNHNG